MDVYRKHVNKTFRLNLANSQELQQWSVKRPQEFWIDLYQYLDLSRVCLSVPGSDVGG